MERASSTMKNPGECFKRPTQEEALNYSKTLIFDPDNVEMCATFGTDKERGVFKLFGEFRIPMPVAVHAMNSDYGNVSKVSDFEHSYGEKSEVADLVNLVSSKGMLSPIFPIQGIINRFWQLVNEAKKKASKKRRYEDQLENAIKGKKLKKNDDSDWSSADSDDASNDDEDVQTARQGIWFENFKKSDTTAMRKSKICSFLDKVIREDQVTEFCRALEGVMGGAIPRWVCPDRATLKCICINMSQGNCSYFNMKKVNNCEATNDRDCSSQRKYKDSEFVEETVFTDRKFGSSSEVIAAFKTLNTGRLILSSGLKVMVGRTNEVGEHQTAEYFSVKCYRDYQSVFEEQTRPGQNRTQFDLVHFCNFLADQCNLMCTSTDNEFKDIWNHESAISWVKKNKSNFLMKFELVLQQKRKAYANGKNLSLDFDGNVDDKNHDKNDDPGGGAPAAKKAKGVKLKPKTTNKKGEALTAEQMRMKKAKKIRAVLKRKGLPIPVEYQAAPAPKKKPKNDKVWASREKTMYYRESGPNAERFENIKGALLLYKQKLNQLHHSY